MKYLAVPALVFISAASGRRDAKNKDQNRTNLSSFPFHLIDGLLALNSAFQELRRS